MQKRSVSRRALWLRRVGRRAHEWSSDTDGRASSPDHHASSDRERVICAGRHDFGESLLKRALWDVLFVLLPFEELG